MPIFQPILPPRAGYVERVNEAGEHYYQPTRETREQAEESDMDLLARAYLEGVSEA